MGERNMEGWKENGVVKGTRMKGWYGVKRARKNGCRKVKGTWKKEGRG